jgi:hypothetical protein
MQASVAQWLARSAVLTERLVVRAHPGVPYFVHFYVLEMVILGIL